MLVIIALAFVGILAAAAMWMVTANFYMKSTDMKTKRSFYNAETVLEQINAGLQVEASSALDIAYNDVMVRYAELSEAERFSEFAKRYVYELRLALRTPVSDQQYDITKLISYVDTPAPGSGITCNITGTGVMSGHNGNITLEGLNVEYTDDKGFTSIISTDICLDIPKIDFTESSQIPEIFDFSMIAGNSLGGPIGTNVVIDGSVYGGKQGISVNSASNWKIQNAQLVVTDESIRILGSGAKLSVSGASAMEPASIWANNVVLDGGSIDLDGKTYLSDDLSLVGSGGSATMKKEFYGYGISETDPAKSSAFIINGKDSSIDMTGLDRLLIGGHAFIGTKKASVSADTLITDAQRAENQDFLMGESIAVKGNQIAYLVPPECVGVLSGNSVIGCNPCTNDQMNVIAAYKLSDPGIFKEVDFNRMVSKLSGPLSLYTNEFKIIHRQCNGSALHYYYLVMSEENAERFFADYYKNPNANNKRKLDSYFDLYTNAIQISSDFDRINIQGNSMISSSASANGVSFLNPTKLADVDLVSESATYTDTFSALKAKLTKKYALLNAQERASGVFDNLLKVSEMNSYADSFGGTAMFQTPDNFFGVLRHGNFTYSATTSNRIRLIVASGDVTVMKDFKGLIIAGGNIYVYQSATFTRSEEELTKVLQSRRVGSTAETDPTFISFFKNASAYVLNGTSVEIGTDVGYQIEVPELVRYENWTKK